MASSLADLLLSQDFVDDPYPVYAAIRAQDPVFFAEPFNAWILTRFADVNTAFTDDRFITDYEGHQTNRVGPEAVEQLYFKVGREFLVLNDPPEHTRLKRIFRAPFTVNRVKQMEPRLHELAKKFVGEIEDKGQAEIVMEYAHKVPFAVISTLLGIPEEHEEQIGQWIGAFYAALFVSPISNDELAAVNEAAGHAQEFFLRLVKERRANATDGDFLSDLIATNDADEEPITDDQIASNLFLIYFGGHDTQRAMFANMINALDQNRDAMAWLLADTNRVDEAFEELLRFDSAGQFMPRTMGEDVELGGKLLQQGQSVMVSMGAANRDPSVFPDPDKLDFTRGPLDGYNVRNMTFGNGRHRCLGFVLARANLPIMLKSLLDTIGEFSVDRSNAVKMPVFEMQAYQSLPITWN